MAKREYWHCHIHEISLFFVITGSEKLLTSIVQKALEKRKYEHICYGLKVVFWLTKIMFNFISSILSETNLRQEEV